jgi:hypothetical protein
VRHGASGYEKGRLDLKAERSAQVDVNYEHQGEHLTYDINPSYSYLVDFIYLDRGEGQLEGFDLYDTRSTSKHNYTD